MISWCAAKRIRNLSFSQITIKSDLFKEKPPERWLFVCISEELHQSRKLIWKQHSYFGATRLQKN
jgi:hypothetical protein